MPVTPKLQFVLKKEKTQHLRCYLSKPYMQRRPTLVQELAYIWGCFLGDRTFFGLACCSTEGLELMHVVETAIL